MLSESSNGRKAKVAQRNETATHAQAVADPVEVVFREKFGDKILKSNRINTQVDQLLNATRDIIFQLECVVDSWNLLSSSMKQCDVHCGSMGTEALLAAKELWNKLDDLDGHMIISRDSIRAEVNGEVKA